MCSIIQALRVGRNTPSPNNKGVAHEEIFEACIVKTKQEGHADARETLVLKTRHEPRKDTRAAHVVKKEFRDRISPCVACFSNAVA